MKVDRRTLLIGGGAGVGLIVGFALWPSGLDSALGVREGEHSFGHFIKIGRDGRVTVAVPQTETGQGIWTALPQIVADELGAAWETVGVEPAPLAAVYGNPLADDKRITANATSVRAFEQPMREAAAVARTMLIGAAADRWNVASDECEATDGLVLHRGKSFTFAELAEEAAARSPPRRPHLREGAKGRLIGRPLQRLDARAKSDGSWRFAGDVRLPGMLFASARLAPPGGKLAGFSRDAARSIAGVRHHAARDGWIAIAADNWWTAERAIKAADPRFIGQRSAQEARPAFERAIESGDFEEWFSQGDFAAATRGSRPLAATYYVAPSQHLGLEPLTATARFTGGSLELWVPTQAPNLAQAAAAQVAGLSSDDVAIYPLPVGEPAGRALDTGVAHIAIELARASGRPVQVTLPQSTGQNHDHLSPGALARMRALPGPGGITAAWSMQVATANGLGASMARLAGDAAPQELGATALDGSAPPYSIPNVSIEACSADLPYQVGYMRGSPQREFAFFTESFIDELARRAGIEPLAFRMSMLGGNGRLARCLQAAARLAQWDGGGPGSTMGIAGCSAYGSQIGLVATATLGADQRIEAHRLVAAVDCGRIVNAGLVRQQVEGAMLWALAQATAAAPESVAGMPRARPFSQIGLPRLAGTPEIIVHPIPSSAPPGGVNGLGATAVAPAIANAIFAGTGRRLRELPFAPM